VSDVDTSGSGEPGAAAPAPGAEAAAHPTRRRRARWRRIVLAAIALAIVAIVAIVVVVRAPFQTTTREEANRRALTFEVPDLVRPAETVALADFRGRPVVLNFWASWCVPCRREMPAFQAVHERVGGRVAFVGMNHQDSRADALVLLRTTGADYPSGFDPRGRVAVAYELFGMPTTVFVGADGRIRRQQTGALSERDLERAIEDLAPMMRCAGT